MGYKGYKEPNTSCVSIWGWIGFFIIMMIPVVNIFAFFVYLLGGGNRNKTNFVRAALIWCLIISAISVAAVFIVGPDTVKLWWDSILKQIQGTTEAFLRF